MEDYINRLKLNGFEGFYSVYNLKNNINVIPKDPGIYKILRLTNDAPIFLKKGVGGYFKGRDPNCPIEKLETNWIENEPLMYIGKAGSIKRNLRRRLNEYMLFGQGKDIGHWGGRLIWQLSDYDELIVCWKILKDIDPRAYEKKFLINFKKVNGKYPFANLKG